MTIKYKKLCKYMTIYIFNKLMPFLLNRYFVSFLFGFISCASVIFLGEGNPIEKLSEEIIKEEMGITIELGPHTLGLDSCNEHK